METVTQPTEQTSVLSIGDWMVTILITAIPLVGFIMLFVWGFGSGTNPNKANWAKATLAWFGILFLFYLFVMVLFGSAILSNL